MSDTPSTEEQVRQQVQRLLALGVSQKAVAGAMGLTTATFSRWVHGRRPTRPLKIDAYHGFVRFRRLLLDEVDRPRPRDQQRLLWAYMQLPPEVRASLLRMVVDTARASLPCGR